MVEIDIPGRLTAEGRFWDNFDPDRPDITLERGYYPVIKYDGRVIWQGKESFSQEQYAIEAAEDYIVAKLKELFT